MEVSCVAADTLCSIKIMHDTAAKDSEAKAELVNTGRILRKDHRLRQQVVIGHICARELFTEVLAGCQTKPLLQ